MQAPYNTCSLQIITEVRFDEALYYVLWILTVESDSFRHFRVCRKWNDTVRRIKRSRRQLGWFLYQQEASPVEQQIEIDLQVIHTNQSQQRPTTDVTIIAKSCYNIQWSPSYMATLSAKVLRSHEEWSFGRGIFTLSCDM